jgi:hypothetical protein
MTKIGRNDLCFCGSGKKYKKCCFQNIDQSHDLNDPPTIKVSEAILLISQPLMEKYSNRGQLTILVDLAILAWNISLASGDKRYEIENKIIELMPKEIDAVDIAAIMEQVDILADRKNKLYPDIDHYIVSYNLSFDSHGQMTLDINSTLNYSLK